MSSLRKAEPDQRTADPERHGRGEHVDQRDPEERIPNERLAWTTPRMGVKATTDTIALMAPNNSVVVVPTVGVLAPVPVQAVKLSMSNWMRWSGLSIGLSRNRPR